MKILITGVSSFIGFHLANRLCSNYDTYTTLSRNIESYDPNGIKFKRIKSLNENLNIIENFDLKNEKFIEDQIKKIMPDAFIFHAGWAENYGNDSYSFEQGFAVNVLPLQNIYRTLDKICKGNVIITGSSMEYSDSLSGNCEDDFCDPSTSYGLIKLMETQFAKFLSKKYNIKTRIIRPYIPYGNFDNPQKLIPQVISSLKSGESIELSNCDQERDFLPINKLVDGYLKILEDLSRESIFDIFNLCSGQKFKLKEILLAMASLLNADENLLKFGARKMRSGEFSTSIGNNEKAQKLLKWDPGSTLENLENFFIDNN